MGDAGRYRRAQVWQPPVLVTAISAVPKDCVEQDIRRRPPALARPRGCRALRLDGKVRRHRHGEGPASARIDADAFAGDKTEQEVVFLPAEPAGLYVTAHMPAITDVIAVDESPVIVIERHQYAGEVDMPPGLRPIRGKGQIGRDASGEIAKNRSARAGAGDAIAERGDTREWGVEYGPGGICVISQDAARRLHGDGRLFGRYRESAAPRARQRIAHLRDALAAGRTHRTAEFHRFGVGVRIGEVRDSLAAEEPAQGAVGKSETRDQTVAAALLQGLATEIGTAGKVPGEKRARLAPGCRGAGLDVDTRLLRAENEDPVAARVIDGGRDRADAWNKLLSDRQRIQVTVLARVGRVVAGIHIIIALQIVEPGQIDKAAEADRGVGTRDQERPREAAADRGGTRRLFGARAGRGSAAGYATGRRHLLGQLVDPALQQFLIGAQIGYLISARRMKPRLQRDCRCQAANRRKTADATCFCRHYPPPESTAKSWVDCARVWPWRYPPLG